MEPGHAPLAIDAVHIVNVAADNQHKTITWDEPLARISLGATAPDTVPRTPEGGAGPADSLLEAAELAWRKGDFGRADELYTAVLSEVDNGPEASGPWHLQILRDHALVAYGLGHWSEGEALLRRVLAGREKLAGRDTAPVIDALARLAEAVGEQERWTEASALAREAVRRADLVLPEEHEAAQGARLALAWVLASTGEPEAEPTVRSLAGALAAVRGPGHPDTLASRHLLVKVLRDQQRFEEAASLARDLLPKRETACGPEHPHTLLLRADLAWLLHRTGQTRQAAVLAEQALAAIKRSSGSQTRYTIRIRDIHHEITAN